MTSNLHIVLWIILLVLYHLCYHATSAVAQEEEAKSYNDDDYDDDSRQAINAQKDSNEAMPENTWWRESQLSRDLEIRESLYVVSIIILFILSTIGGTGWLMYLHIVLRQQPFFMRKTNVKEQTLEQVLEQVSKPEPELPTRIPTVHFEDETKPEPQKGLSKEEEPKQAEPLKAPIAPKYSKMQFYKWEEKTQKRKTHSKKKHVVPGKDDTPPLSRISPCLTISEYNGIKFYKWKEKTHSQKEQALPGKAVLLPPRPPLPTAEHEGIKFYKWKEKTHSRKEQALPGKAVLLPPRPPLPTAEHEGRIKVIKSQEKTYSEKKPEVPDTAKVTHHKKNVPK